MRPRPRTPAAGGPVGRNPQATGQAQNPTAGYESTLIRIAHIVFLASEVKSAIEHMHNMKPDERGVLKSASRWYYASKCVGDSLDELRLSDISLAAHWKGDAYGAFHEHMQGNVIPAAERNEGTLYDIGTALIEVHNKVTEHYSQAVLQLGQTVTNALTLEAEWQAAKGETKEAKRALLISAINLFVQGMIYRKAEVEKAVADHAAAMTALRGKVQQLRTPGKVPPEIRRKGSWDPT